MLDAEILAAVETVLALGGRRTLRIGTAESCTGGLIAGALTAVSGSSDVIEAGFVTYSNEAKMAMLGVPAALFPAVGAVSDEVAAAMAEGVLDRLPRVDLAVSVTGIAGPGGGSAEKPVGLVHFGLARRGLPTTTAHAVFPGDRTRIRRATVLRALALLEAGDLTDRFVNNRRKGMPGMARDDDNPAVEPSYGLDLGRRLIIRDIEIAGSGVIILTGPSSCGKGEIAKAMGELLSIEPGRWLSMGDILRRTYERARAPDFMKLLEERYSISDRVPILDCIDSKPDLARKVEEQAVPLAAALAEKRGTAADWRSASQLDWLEFCTTHGLLVPNRWTQALIAADIQQLPDLDKKIFLLDGYPRTRVAAERLLEDLAALGLPVLKVLHLSISKQEMLHRAGLRGRIDDDKASLLKRFDFYVESVQPSVDYLKEKLGADRIALIDAHQPHYTVENGESRFDLDRSIENVVRSALRGLGLPRFVIGRMLASHHAKAGVSPTE